MTAFEISAAYVADWILGDPSGFPHPVRLIGRGILFLESRFLIRGASPATAATPGGDSGIIGCPRSICLHLGDYPNG